MASVPVTRPKATPKRAGHPCTYLRCLEPATRRLQPSSGGRPWYGCDEHAGAMTAALYIGLSGASWGGGTVDVDELEPPGTPTPGPRTPAAGGVS